MTAILPQTRDVPNLRAGLLVAHGRYPHLGFGRDLSPADREKINAFMHALRYVRYAMTLGGPRTTIAHPVTSSHYDVPEEERRKMGITFGLIRVSVGLEDPEDLIADFTNALKVFDD